jgi:F420-dependent oxidoreductase-like protein
LPRTLEGVTAFGVHTGLQNTSVDELVALWQRIEDLGFDWISIWDHFYAADGTGEPHCLEAVSAHTALACHTTRVRCGSLVYSVGYRHPAVLANAIATIDHLSGGRADIGLGAGWSQVEYDAYGIAFPSVGARLSQLAEAVQCVRGLLREESTTFEGKYFTMRDAKCEPKPLQAALPIWIGGGGEKRTLKIAAKYADGWNVPFISPDAYRHKVSVLHQHCEEAGRDPSEIKLTVNVGLAWREEDLVPQFGNIASFVRPGVLMGTEEEVVDHVGRYADAGAQQINIAMRAPWDVEGLERLAAALRIA